MVRYHQISSCQIWACWGQGCTKNKAKIIWELWEKNVNSWNSEYIGLMLQKITLATVFFNEYFSKAMRSRMCYTSLGFVVVYLILPFHQKQTFIKWLQGSGGLTKSNVHKIDLWCSFQHILATTRWSLISVWTKCRTVRKVEINCNMLLSTPSEANT